MRTILFAALLTWQAACLAQETVSVFGLVCNEPFVSVAKKVKLFDVTEADLQKYKILRHPDYWNIFSNDPGFAKFAWSLPDKSVDITVTSLRFLHNALADVFIQFSQQIDDARLTQGDARAQEIAFELGRKHSVLPTREDKSEGFMSLSRATDWSVKMPAGTVTIGSRLVTADREQQNYRSVVLVRVKFSETCGQGRKPKVTS